MLRSLIEVPARGLRERFILVFVALVVRRFGTWVLGSLCVMTPLYINFRQLNGLYLSRLCRRTEPSSLTRYDWSFNVRGLGIYLLALIKKSFESVTFADWYVWWIGACSAMARLQALFTPHQYAHHIHIGWLFQFFQFAFLLFYLSYTFLSVKLTYVGDLVLLFIL